MKYIAVIRYLRHTVITNRVDVPSSIEPAQHNAEYALENIPILQELDERTRDI
jgi:hypothetical protein